MLGMWPRRNLQGAGEVVLSRCTCALTGSGEEAPLTQEVRHALLAQLEAMGEKGLRVLALARRTRLPAALAHIRSGGPTAHRSDNGAGPVRADGKGDTAPSASPFPARGREGGEGTAEGDGEREEEAGAEGLPSVELPPELRDATKFAELESDLTFVGLAGIQVRKGGPRSPGCLPTHVAVPCLVIVLLLSLCSASDPKP